jgi:hypothetical protein
MILKPNQMQSAEDIPQIRRVFLRSKAYSGSSSHLNQSDGIVVPYTFFNILTDKQYQKVLEYFKMQPLFV